MVTVEAASEGSHPMILASGLNHLTKGSRLLIMAADHQKAGSSGLLLALLEANNASDQLILSAFHCTSLCFDNLLHKTTVTRAPCSTRCP